MERHPSGIPVKDRFQRREVSKKLSTYKYELTYHGVDMITYDDDPNILKASMLCGHVISCESMKDYCSDQLNKGKTAIKCPDLNCGKTWPFHACKQIMKYSATVKEIEEMDDKINTNYICKLKNVEQCPTCFYYLEKPSNVTSDLITCPQCMANGRNERFCWLCKMPWISESENDCGNASCDKGSKKLKILATCPETVIINRSTPSVRGCTKCGMLIEHIEACNHMICPGCKHCFCFYCLKGPIFKEPICVVGCKTCVIAARQTYLPNM